MKNVYLHTLLISLSLFGSLAARAEDLNSLEGRGNATAKAAVDYGIGSAVLGAYSLYPDSRVSAAHEATLEAHQRSIKATETFRNVLAQDEYRLLPERYEQKIEPLREEFLRAASDMRERQGSAFDFDRKLWMSIAMDNSSRPAGVLKEEIDALKVIGNAQEKNSGPALTYWLKKLRDGDVDGISKHFSLGEDGKKTLAGAKVAFEKAEKEGAAISRDLFGLEMARARESKAIAALNKFVDENLSMSDAEYKALLTQAESESIDAAEDVKAKTAAEKIALKEYNGSVRKFSKVASGLGSLILFTRAGMTASQALAAYLQQDEPGVQSSAALQERVNSKPNLVSEHSTAEENSKPIDAAPAK